MTPDTTMDTRAQGRVLLALGIGGIVIGAMLCVLAAIAQHAERMGAMQ